MRLAAVDDNAVLVIEMRLHALISMYVALTSLTVVSRVGAEALGSALLPS